VKIYSPTDRLNKKATFLKSKSIVQIA